MDISGLKYFLKVAECLNFTRAANECFITQTAMSQHIANMERELGFQLFVRNNRKVELTVAGRNFYERISKLMEDYESAVRSSQDLASGAAGSVVIATTSCIENLFLMSRICYFKTRYPALNLSIIIIRPCEMVEYLQRGKCDLAVGFPYDMAETEGLRVHILETFKPRIVCSGNHPLSKNRRITPEMLRDQQIVMLNLKNMPATRAQVRQDMEALGLKAFQNVTVSSQIERLEEVLFMTSVTSQLAIVPEYVVNHTTGDMAFLELDAPKAVTIPVGIGYVEAIANPALPLAIDVLRDSRIPLNY